MKVYLLPREENPVTFTFSLFSLSIWLPLSPMLVLSRPHVYDFFLEQASSRFSTPSLVRPFALLVARPFTKLFPRTPFSQGIRLPRRIFQKPFILKFFFFLRFFYLNWTYQVTRSVVLELKFSLGIFVRLLRGSSTRSKTLPPGFSREKVLYPPLTRHSLPSFLQIPPPPFLPLPHLNLLLVSLPFPPPPLLPHPLSPPPTHRPLPSYSPTGRASPTYGL